MQFPEEWDYKIRGNLASSSNPSSFPRAAKNISNEELEAFSKDVLTRNVNLSVDFIRCIGDDLDSIHSRITSMLPSQQNQPPPGSSASVKRSGGKRKCADSAADFSPPPESTNNNDTPTDAVSGQASVNMTAARPRSEMRLELNTLLSKLPYKRLMQEMVAQNANSKMLPSVPYVSRQYEETYMREASNAGERACAMGDECECMFIDKNNPFTGVEFIVPGEDTSAHPEYCVICSRATTQQLFYDIVFDGVVINALIQRYGNIHGVENEYSQEVMLICPPNGPVNCMPLPIVSHSRNRYSVVKVGGVRWIRQHGVHFQ
jgi:hypothetical protein